MASSAFNAIVQLISDLSTDERLQLVNILSESLRVNTAKNLLFQQERMSVKVTRGSINYSYINISKLFDQGFFPSDAVGEPIAKDGLGKSIYLHVSGLRSVIETDISPKKFIRRRSWVERFNRKHNLRPGDYVVFEKLSDRKYRVYPMKAREN